MLKTFAQDFDAYPYTTMYDTNSSVGMEYFMPILLISLAIGVITIAALWRIFTKAGKPGWAAIIPIYNTVVLLEIVGRPLWWVLLFFASVIPLIGPIIALVVGVIVANDLAKAFGKGVGHTILLVLLPFIGFPMLAWGDAKYHGTSANTAGGATPPATPPATTPPTQPTPPATPPATPPSTPSV